MFLPEGLDYDNAYVTHISPLHGRSVAIQTGDFDWITIKGGGWNYGGPQVYISNKDEELIFGLYSLSSAERELKISNEIEKFSDDFPKVLYFREFSKSNLPRKFGMIPDVKYSNGEKAMPCLLYTRVKCPFRIADLAFLTDKEKRRLIKQCCAYWDASSPDDYIKKFIARLASHIAILHKHDFINDTLDWGNVTMFAEIIDYEWITAPDVELPDGTCGRQLVKERKEKEILYGAEACLKMAAMLHKDYDLFDIYEIFVCAYKEINPQFVENNENIQKILKREMMVL